MFKHMRLWGHFTFKDITLVDKVYVFNTESPKCVIRYTVVHN